MNKDIILIIKKQQFYKSIKIDNTNFPRQILFVIKIINIGLQEIKIINNYKNIINNLVYFLLGL